MASRESKFGQGISKSTRDMWLDSQAKIATLLQAGHLHKFV